MTDEPTTSPLHDTWMWWSDGASWIGNYALAELPTNRWCSEVIDGWLADFDDLVRVRGMTIIDDVGSSRLDWVGRYATFRTAVIATLRDHRTPIQLVTLDLDLHAWFRTEDAPEQAMLGWLMSPAAKMEMSIDREDQSAWIAFSMEHSLFAAVSPHRQDNRELHAFNQPRLEAALAAWQARSGTPLLVEGVLRGRREYGFSSDRDDY